MVGTLCSQLEINSREEYLAMSRVEEGLRGVWYTIRAACHVKASGS